MAQAPVYLNLGCGFNKKEGFINVDGFEVCNPDVLHNLNEVPLPWDDYSVDGIIAFHVMEHLENWWDCFKDCVRVLKVGGTIEIRVPHPSSDTALTYRDHLHPIDLRSFDGIIQGPQRTTNAWFESQEKVPVILETYYLVPFNQYQWFPKWMLKICADHLRNFIWEQRILFKKVKV